MGGSKKCGIFPINPGEVSDRQLAPSKAIHPQRPSQVGSESEKAKQAESSSDSPVAGNQLFTPEEEVLYKRRYNEGYDLADPGYMAWLKINHPELSSASGNFSTSTVSTSNSAEIATCRSKSPDVLSQLLVLPEPRKTTRRRRKPALNSKTVCITDIEVLDELKAQELEKAEVEAVKKVKQLEREQKRLRKEENRKAKEKQKKIKGKQSLKSSQTKPVSKKSKPKTALRKQATRKGRSLSGMASRLTICDSEQTSDEDDAVCSECGKIFADDADGFWICCDGCDHWFDLSCTTVSSKEAVPEQYFCGSCIQQL